MAPPRPYRHPRGPRPLPPKPARAAVAVLALSVVFLGCAASRVPLAPALPSLPPGGLSGRCVVDRAEGSAVVVEYPDGHTEDAPEGAFTRTPPEGLIFPCGYLAVVPR